MISEVSPKNISEAAFVYMRSWKDSHRDICPPEFIEKHDIAYMTVFLSRKLDEGYNLYMKYSGGFGVGIIGINPADEEICFLYILPEEQGKGFGSELLEFAIAKCKNPYIIVLDSKKNAIDFYLKRGFVPAEKQPEYTAEKRIFERKYVYQNKNM